MSACIKAPSRPRVLQVSPEGIPEELRVIPAWVCWILEWRKGIWAKVPVSCRTGRAAQIDDPASRTTFQDAYDTFQRDKYDGIGLCRTGDLVFIDVDGCRDPDTGAIADWPWVAGILNSVAGRAYVEVSLSGTGIHGVARGGLPNGRRQWNDRTRNHVGFALYDRTRYFAFTGHVLPETGPIQDLSHELVDLHRRLFNVGRSIKPPAQQRRTGDRTASAAKSTSAEFTGLWRGNWADR